MGKPRQMPWWMAGTASLVHGEHHQEKVGEAWMTLTSESLSGMSQIQTLSRVRGF